MKEKQHQKKLIGFMVMIVLLLISTACRAQEMPPPDEPEVPEVEMPAEEPPEEEEEDEEISGEANVVHMAEGKYVGFADSRSVEIELINGEYDYMVFQLEESVQQQLESDEPEPGSIVTIHFKIPNQGQPMITLLEQ